MFIVASILLFGHALSEGNLKHLTGDDLTTSVIIPCCAKHAQHLYPLLKRYEYQTELPNEAVISLSESGQVPSTILDALQKELWKFPVTLILSEKKLFAGPNRNKACEHATGDLLICQDADDIPYPQRVEIIKYFFKTYAIDHLIHQWSELNQDGTLPFERRDKLFRLHLLLYKDFSQMQFFYPKTFNDVWEPDTFTNGNIAISRRVFDAVKWSDEPRGQDSIFNKNVYARFQNCIAIKVPLLVYRSFLSSVKKSEEQEDKNSKLYSLTIVRS